MDQLLNPRDMDFLLYEFVELETVLKRERYRSLSRPSCTAFLLQIRNLAARHLAQQRSEQTTGHSKKQGCKSATKKYSREPRTPPALCLHGPQRRVWDYCGPIQTIWKVRCNCPLLRDFFSPCKDGSYHISGTKAYFIVAEHPLAENLIHLVFASIEGQERDAQELSLFIVPSQLTNRCGSIQRPNRLKLIRALPKLGMSNTLAGIVKFGEEGESGDEYGTVGYLLGEPYCAFDYLYQQAGDARIRVGLNAAAVANRGYLQENAVEQMYRDQQLNSLIEGASIGSGRGLLTRIIPRYDRYNYEVLRQQIRITIHVASSQEAIQWAAQPLEDALNRTDKVTNELFKRIERQQDNALRTARQSNTKK